MKANIQYPSKKVASATIEKISFPIETIEKIFVAAGFEPFEVTLNVTVRADDKYSDDYEKEQKFLSLRFDGKEIDSDRQSLRESSDYLVLVAPIFEKIITSGFAEMISIFGVGNAQEKILDKYFKPAEKKSEKQEKSKKPKKSKKSKKPFNKEY